MCAVQTRYYQNTAVLIFVTLAADFCRWMQAFRQSFLDEPLFASPRNRASFWIADPYQICRNDHTRSGGTPSLTPKGRALSRLQRPPRRYYFYCCIILTLLGNMLASYRLLLPFKNEISVYMKSHGVPSSKHSPPHLNETNPLTFCGVKIRTELLNIIWATWNISEWQNCGTWNWLENAYIQKCALWT